MLLQLQGVQAYYGKSHILHGVDMNVREGEIVSLLGRNGSGRSTTVKAIMGLVAAEGSIRLRNEEILGHRTFHIAHRGVGYVPENRDIFPKLTVEQNLQLGEKRGAKKPRWSFDDMYRLFPRLKERANTEAGVLSGGEQQMLTLCRTLMGDPDLIMIDEPTAGMSKSETARFIDLIREVTVGKTLLTVEHDMGVVFGLADKIAVLVYGEVIAFDTPDAVRANPRVQEAYLGSVLADAQVAGAARPAH